MVMQWLALALSLLLCLRSADFMPAAGMLRSFDRCSFVEPGAFRGHALARNFSKHVPN